MPLPRGSSSPTRMVIQGKSVLYRYSTCGQWVAEERQPIREDSGRGLQASMFPPSSYTSHYPPSLCIAHRPCFMLHGHKSKMIFPLRYNGIRGNRNNDNINFLLCKLKSNCKQLAHTCHARYVPYCHHHR